MTKRKREEGVKLMFENSVYEEVGISVDEREGVGQVAG